MALVNGSKILINLKQIIMKVNITEKRKMDKVLSPGLMEAFIAEIIFAIKEINMEK